MLASVNVELRLLHQLFEIWFSFSSFGTPKLFLRDKTDFLVSSKVRISYHWGYLLCILFMNCILFKNFLLIASHFQVPMFLNLAEENNCCRIDCSEGTVDKPHGFEVRWA